MTARHAPPAPLRLDNDRICIEFEPRTGTIERFSHRAFGVDLVQERRLAENFRLLLPLPHLRGHYISGRDQRLDSAEIDGDRAVLRWRGLQSAHGRFDVVVELTVTLEGDTATFVPRIENRSDHVVEELLCPAVGGLANQTEADDWRIHWCGGNGRGQEWKLFSEFPGTYLGPEYPVWLLPYSTGACMPWVDLYHAAARRGVYVGRHDPVARHTTFYAQLRPGTTYRGAVQRWPDQEVLGPDVPIGLTLGWAVFPFVPSGGSSESAPIVFHFHEGTWRAAADYYRAWWDLHFQVAQPTWLTREDAWQSTIISFPEDTIRFRFADLPKLAEAALAAGIRVLQIDGWDVGGIDRAYPHYTPDPRLGTWDELRQAIQNCQAMGVRVLLFGNLHVANIETDWYRDELQHYAVRDPRGIPRNTVGWEYGTTLGLERECEYRMVRLNPSHPRFRELWVDQMLNAARLGADGAQIDKLHGGGQAIDYNPVAPGDRDSTLPVGLLEALAEYHRRAREINPEFALAAESHWNCVMPYCSAAYSRFFVADHVPTFHYTFPEFKESCCITGPHDFGLVNNSIRFGHIINVEGKQLHGSAADVPVLARYVAEVLRLRRRLAHVLWDSYPAEPLGWDVVGDTVWTLHQSRTTRDQALVLNHFHDAPVEVSLSHSGKSGHPAHIHRPFREPERSVLPLRVSVGQDELVVVHIPDAEETAA